jgi:hypothetical protein
VKVETFRPVYIPFNVYEINCCVIDCHICVFYIYQNTSGWQTLKKNFVVCTVWCKIIDIDIEQNT